MLEIILIRHGKTYGNTQGKYIGKRTDESLCEEGISLLEEKKYPKVSVVYASPMKRCLETAKKLYPEASLYINEDMVECDFGDFENKNYLELSENADYQAWIDSDGKLPFPGGESSEEFQKRCCKGFEACVEDAFKHGYKKIGMVVHGGTIMSILSKFTLPAGNYFQWQIKNGEYYQLMLESFVWKKEGRISSVKRGC